MEDNKKSRSFIELGFFFVINCKKLHLFKKTSMLFSQILMDNGRGTGKTDH